MAIIEDPRLDEVRVKFRKNPDRVQMKWRFSGPNQTYQYKTFHMDPWYED